MRIQNTAGEFIFDASRHILRSKGQIRNSGQLKIIYGALFAIRQRICVAYHDTIV